MAHSTARTSNPSPKMDYTLSNDEIMDLQAALNSLEKNCSLDPSVKGQRQAVDLNKRALSAANNMSNRILPSFIAHVYYRLKTIPDDPRKVEAPCNRHSLFLQQANRAFALNFTEQIVGDYAVPLPLTRQQHPAGLVGQEEGGILHMTP